MKAGNTTGQKAVSSLGQPERIEAPGSKILEAYKLKEKHIAYVWTAALRFSRRHGIGVELCDLSQAIEHKDTLADKAELDHETAVSDGQTVRLHQDLDASGGLASRVFDLLHMAAGHLWQWGSDKDSGLQHYGQDAWEVAGKNYMYGSKTKLLEARSYEEEAHRLALTQLEEMLKDSSLGPRLQKRIMRFYNDYMQTDLDYIIDYYKTGKLKGFFESWKQDAAALAKKKINSDFSPQRRTGDIFPLLRSSLPDNTDQ